MRSKEGGPALGGEKHVSLMPQRIVVGSSRKVAGKAKGVFHKRGREGGGCPKKKCRLCLMRARPWGVEATQ